MNASFKSAYEVPIKITAEKAQPFNTTFARKFAVMFSTFPKSGNNLALELGSVIRFRYRQAEWKLTQLKEREDGSFEAQISTIEKIKFASYKGREVIGEHKYVYSDDIVLTIKDLRFGGYAINRKTQGYCYLDIQIRIKAEEVPLICGGAKTPEQFMIATALTSLADNSFTAMVLYTDPKTIPTRKAGTKTNYTVRMSNGKILYLPNGDTRDKITKELRNSYNPDTISFEVSKQSFKQDIIYWNLDMGELKYISPSGQQMSYVISGCSELSRSALLGVLESNWSDVLITFNKDPLQIFLNSLKRFLHQEIGIEEGDKFINYVSYASKPSEFIVDFGIIAKTDRAVNLLTKYIAWLRTNTGMSTIDHPLRRYSILGLINAIIPIVGKYNDLKAEIKDQIDKMQNATSEDMPTYPANLRDDLEFYPHQADVLGKASFSAETIGFDVSTGGGKTLLLICHILKGMQDGSMLKPIIVMPTNLVVQWFDQIHYFCNSTINCIALSSDTVNSWGDENIKQLIASAPTNTIYIAAIDWITNGVTKNKVGKADAYYFPNIDMLKEFKFDAVFIDESHKIKSSGTNAHQALLQLGKMAFKKGIATGTIVPNKQSDIVGQINFLDPSLFGNVQQFEKRYLKNRKTGEFHEFAKSEIQNKLKSIGVISKTRKDWFFVLPKIRDNFHIVKLTKNQSVLYKTMIDEALFDFSTDPNMSAAWSSFQIDPEAENLPPMFLARLRSIESFSSDPAASVFGVEGILNEPDDLISPKLPVVLKILEKHFSETPDDKVLIFTQFKEAVIEHFYNNLGPFQSMAKLYRGGLKRNLEAFKSDPKVKILVACDQCFSGDTPVLIDYDKALPIQEVCENDSITHVLCYDLENKEIIKRKINHKFINDASKDTFMNLSIEGPNKGKRYTVKVTPNHEIWSHDRQCYVRVDQLKIGEQVVTYDGDFEYYRSCSHCNEIIPRNRQAQAEHNSFHLRAGKSFAEQFGKARSERIKTGTTWDEVLGKKRANELRDDRRKRIAKGEMLFNRGFCSEPNNKEQAIIDLEIKNLFFTGGSPFWVNLGPYEFEECKQCIHTHRKCKLQTTNNLIKNPDFIYIENPICFNCSQFDDCIAEKDEIIGSCFEPNFKTTRFNKVVEVNGKHCHCRKDVDTYRELYKRKGIDCLNITAEKIAPKNMERIRGALESHCNNHYSRVIDIRRSGAKIDKRYTLEVDGPHNYFVVARTTEGNKQKKGVPFLVKNSIKEGQNLQMASRMIRLDVHWSPGDLDQVIARVYRLLKGSSREFVYIDWVLADNTIDVIKFRRAIRKLVLNSVMMGIVPDGSIPERPILKVGKQQLLYETDWQFAERDEVSDYKRYRDLEREQWEIKRETENIDFVQVKTDNTKISGPIIRTPLPSGAKLPNSDDRVTGLDALDEWAKGDPKLLIGYRCDTEFGLGTIRSATITRAKVLRFKISFDNPEIATRSLDGSSVEVLEEVDTTIAEEKIEINIPGKDVTIGGRIFWVTPDGMVHKTRKENGINVLGKIVYLFDGFQWITPNGSIANNVSEKADEGLRGVLKELGYKLPKGSSTKPPKEKGEKKSVAEFRFTAIVDGVREKYVLLPTGEISIVRQRGNNEIYLKPHIKYIDDNFTYTKGMYKGKLAFTLPVRRKLESYLPNVGFKGKVTRVVKETTRIPRETKPATRTTRVPRKRIPRETKPTVRETRVRVPRKNLQPVRMPRKSPVDIERVLPSKPIGRKKGKLLIERPDNMQGYSFRNDKKLPRIMDKEGTIYRPYKDGTLMLIYVFDPKTQEWKTATGRPANFDLNASKKLLKELGILNHIGDGRRRQSTKTLPNTVEEVKIELKAINFGGVPVIGVFYNNEDDADPINIALRSKKFYKFDFMRISLVTATKLNRIRKAITERGFVPKNKTELEFIMDNWRKAEFHMKDYDRFMVKEFKTVMKLNWKSTAFYMQPAIVDGKLEIWVPAMKERIITSRLKTFTKLKFERASIFMKHFLTIGTLNQGGVFALAALKARGIKVINEKEFKNSIKNIKKRIS